MQNLWHVTLNSSRFSNSSVGFQYLDLDPSIDKRFLAGYVPLLNSRSGYSTLIA